MGFFDHFLRDVRQILFRDEEQNAIPSMDGALSPNDRLDQCSAVGDPLPGLDDVAPAPDGSIYVSAGKSVLRLSGAGFASRAIVAEFDSEAGGLALHPDGSLLVCVTGHGLAAVAPNGANRWLRTAGGRMLVGPTAVTAAPDGTIYIAEGSIDRRPEEWLRDLMEKRANGRLLRASPSLESAEVLLENLAYPNGVMVGTEGSLLYSESWSHAVSRASRDGTHLGAPSAIARNLVGYPARLRPSSDGSFWLPCFGVRTHLTEFVLREDEFREEMLRTVSQQYWLGPALSSGHDCLEPMQIGSVKALGIQKPWAPPRSYGLLVRMHASGEIIESLHSRADGKYHGITAACDTPQGLVIASKGAGRLLLRAGERQ
jgi:hypothetical protein